MTETETTGTIFNIQKFSVHDGPGIRTTVFMKGCPLRCRWCSNAESMNARQEIGIIRDICNGCGKCADLCPEGAIILESETIEIDREKCTACGECVGVCVPGALTVYGRPVTVDEVLREVERDRIYYDNGGGITVSGGEPLRQAEFVADLFRTCREAGIGTCLDTCGYAPTDKLEKVLEYADNILYDIKLLDPARHEEFTGVNNGLILKNAATVAASGANMLCRIPLVAGVNDTETNIAATADFLASLREGIDVEVLPYHRLGIGKYRTLDRDYPGAALSTPDEAHMKTVQEIFSVRGIRCIIGG